MTRVAFGLLISLSGLVPGAALVAQPDPGQPAGPIPPEYLPPGGGSGPGRPGPSPGAAAASEP